MQNVEQQHGIDDRALKAVVPLTADYGTYHQMKLDRNAFEKAGPQVLSIKPVREGWEPINLCGVTLRPAEAAVGDRRADKP
jgi:hypothetical protein